MVMPVEALTRFASGTRSTCTMTAAHGRNEPCSNRSLGGRSLGPQSFATQHSPNIAIPNVSARIPVRPVS